MSESNSNNDTDNASKRAKDLELMHQITMLAGTFPSTVKFYALQLRLSSEKSHSSIPSNRNRLFTDKINKAKNSMAAAKASAASAAAAPSYQRQYSASRYHPYTNSSYSSGTYHSRQSAPHYSSGNRGYKRPTSYGDPAAASSYNKTYYPPKPSSTGASTTASATDTPSPGASAIPTPIPLAPSTPAPVVTTIGGQKTVTLNGSQYISKNGKLIRITNPLQQQQIAASTVTSIAPTPVTAPVQTAPAAQPTYIRTKAGSLVRVGSASSKPTTPKPNSSTPGTGRAKVNNKDVLLNPRIMPYCPQFTLTGKCTKGGRCPYARHDTGHLALCKQFLMRNGNCSKGNRCSLSHNPNDHNLPTCTYYLDDKCSSMCGHGHKNDFMNTIDTKGSSKKKEPTECKFAHPPKLAPGTPENEAQKLCREFAYTGYCTLGSQRCPYVHSYQCPDFSETGSCKVRNCKLMHVNEGNHHKQQQQPKPVPTKEPEMINPLQLAESLFDDDDDDSSDEEGASGTVGSKDVDMDKEDEEEYNGSDDDDETQEFLEFWRRKSSLSAAGGETKEQDDFSKDSDYIGF